MIIPEIEDTATAVDDAPIDIQQQRCGTCAAHTHAYVRHSYDDTAVRRVLRYDVWPPPAARGKEAGCFFFFCFCFVYAENYEGGG